MFDLKRTGVYVLTASMMVFTVACDMNEISIIPADINITGDQIISVANDYASALVDIDASKIISLSSSVSEDNKEFLESFNFESVYGEDSAAVYETYYSTISYDVLEDTVKIDGDKASVNVRFNYADYYSIAPDSYDADGWISAINSSDSIENIDIKFEVELKNINGVDTPVIKNSNKIINKYFFDEVANVYFYVETFVFYEDVVDLAFSKESYEATDTIHVAVSFDGDDRPNDKDVKVSVFDMSMNSIFELDTTYAAGTSFDVTVDAQDVGIDYFEDGFYSVVAEAKDGSIYATNKVFVNKFVEPEFDLAILTGLYESTELAYSKPKKDVLGGYTKALGEYVNEYFDVVIDTPDSELVYNAYELVNSKLLKEIPYKCDLALVPKDDADLESYVFITNIDKEITSAQELTDFFSLNGVDVKCDGGMQLGDDYLFIAHSTIQKEVIDDDDEAVVEEVEGESDENSSEVIENNTEETIETLESDSAIEETSLEETDSEVEETAIEDVNAEDVNTEETANEASLDEEPADEEPAIKFIDKSVTYLVKYKEGHLLIIEFVGDDQALMDSYITSIRSLNSDTSVSEIAEFSIADDASIADIESPVENDTSDNESEE